MEVWVQIVIPIITGLVATVPLVIKIIDVTKKNVKEQNWSALLSLMLKLMIEAESLYESGAERKQYVISAIKTLEPTLNYEVDIDKVGAMVDAIVEASKKINVDKK